MEKKLIFNEHGERGTQSMIGGNTTNLREWNRIKYDWANQMYRTMLNNFWIPEEISLNEDVKQFPYLTDYERRAFDKIIAFLNFLDSIQSENLPNLSRYITASEVASLLNIQAFQEEIHAQSYSYILDTVTNPITRDKIYDEWRTDKTLLERNRFIADAYQRFSDEPSEANLIHTIIANYILEGIYFYSGFSFFYTLARQGKMALTMKELQEMEQKTYDLSSLRTGVMAGSLCPPEIMKKVKEQMNMHEITICYGMTETSPVSTQTKIGVPFEKQIYSVGTIHDHLEIKIIDPETKATLKRGESGELCTRGYSVMLKYWNSPDATHQVLDEQRWMHTGDLAMMDEEGYLHISGRIKDLIIRGGENISPKEIEDFLYTYKGVMDAQVIGVPSEKYGEEIMAWIKPKEGVTITEEEIRDFCKDRIAHYKIPKYWKFVSEFPMTISGKIRKVEMREIAARELGLEPEE